MNRFQMEFGDGHLASAGTSTFAASECVFNVGEIITDVVVNTKLLFGLSLTTGITFITDEQTCTTGSSTGDAETFSGERLLYIKGRIRYSVVSHLNFVFSSC